MIKLSNTISQNLSVQLSTSIALDKGVEHIHEMVKENEDKLTSLSFIRAAKSFLLAANKKMFFSGKLPPHHFLRDEPEVLEQTLKYASARHLGEYRDSGTPYLAHVLSSGFILARLGLPKEVILAGILHDAIEDSSDKTKTLNELYALKPDIALFVYSVSGPDIKDSIEKDRILYEKISSISEQAGNIFPQAIKCADGIANLFDLDKMVAKDGRNAIQRQALFLEKVSSKALSFAAEIDKSGLLPLRKRNEIFSLHEYIKSLTDEKRVELMA
jgi:(p)ppGpp synthase/HD superfamily hydrolase